MMHPPCPAWVVGMDWDETITAQDTLSLLAPTEHEQLSQSRPFTYYVDAYMQDLAKFAEHPHPLDSEEAVRAYIAALQPIERGSITRIEDGGLFRGTHPASRRARASHVEFRAGWEEWSRWARPRCRDHTLAMHIISVNWSRAFILDALAAQAKIGPSGVDPSPALGLTAVHANEIEVAQGTESCTGRVVGPLPGDAPVLTGLDKLVVWNEMLSQYIPSPRTIYVGDSLHDWPCLQQADVGVVMGPKPSLMTKLAGTELALQIVSFGAWKQEFERHKPRLPRGLVHVVDWHEVVHLCTLLTEEAGPMP